MSTLIVIVLFGLGFAFLATQNTAAATVNILGYAWTLPMYLLVFGSLLLGFFISWIVSSVSTLGTWFSLQGKNSKIREKEQTVSQLENRIRDLELENAKLQGRREVSSTKIVEEPVLENKPRTFMDRFRRQPLLIK